MTSAETPGATPYGSAADLPSVRKMLLELKGMKALTLLIARDQRAEVRRLEAEIKRMVQVVDRFYERIGERHWIFNDHLKFDDLADAVESADDDDELETRFIELHRAWLQRDFWYAGRFMRHQAIRARRGQLDRARDHYLGREFDSATLHLIAVMDGFVNDFQPGLRRGLHAREPDEMVAWDNVVGHHLGLTNALGPFRQTFKKRHDSEVFELHRNGIVHGAITNFDNEIVATKAWNMLVAVLDWARATEEAEKPVEPTPTFRESMQSLARHAERNRHRDAFESRVVAADSSGFDVEPVVERTREFLRLWQNRNYGDLPSMAMPDLVDGMDPGRRPRFARDCFDAFQLVEYRLLRVTYTMAAVAEMRASAQVGDQSGELDLRWIRVADDGNYVPSTLPGEWYLQHWSPSQCWKPAS